jgi:hypothetical protein
METGIQVSCPYCGRSQFLTMRRLTEKELAEIDTLCGDDAKLPDNGAYAFAGHTQCECKKCFVATLSVIPLEKVKGDQ